MEVERVEPSQSLAADPLHGRGALQIQRVERGLGAFCFRRCKQSVRDARDLAR